MNNLKQLRINLDLTLDELSEELNINRATLSRLENNKTELNESYIQIFTKYFNCSADYLLGYSKVISKHSNNIAIPYYHKDNFIDIIDQEIIVKNPSNYLLTLITDQSDDLKKMFWYESDFIQYNINNFIDHPYKTSLLINSLFNVQDLKDDDLVLLSIKNIQDYTPKIFKVLKFDFESIDSNDNQDVSTSTFLISIGTDRLNTVNINAQYIHIYGLIEKIHTNKN